MKELTSFELDYMYSVLTDKLDKCICDGTFGYEDEIAQLHTCLAKLITMEAAIRKAEAQEAAQS